MFLPVACLKCGKVFQVPQAAAGTEIACPWCKATTPALPVAGMPAPPPSDPPPELLSLDDDDAPAPRSPSRLTDEGPAPARTFSLRTAVIGTVLVVVVAALTIAILRYGSGSISPLSWVDFTPPDGSCTIALPGSPATESVAPSSADGVTRGMQLVTTSGWYSRARVWFGWRDLDPGWVKQAQLDRDGAITTPVLTVERDRRKEEVGGTITKEATVRYGPNLGLEVQMDTRRGKLIERYIIALGGSRPRLYFMGIEAKNAAAESAAAQKLFNSFRVSN
jgi:hypothetical protein